MKVDGCPYVLVSKETSTGYTCNICGNCEGGESFFDFAAPGTPKLGVDEQWVAEKFSGLPPFQGWFSVKVRQSWKQKFSDFQQWISEHISLPGTMLRNQMGQNCRNQVVNTWCRSFFYMGVLGFYRPHVEPSRKINQNKSILKVFCSSPACDRKEQLDKAWGYVCEMEGVNFTCHPFCALPERISEAQLGPDHLAPCPS